jgi:hypothetical protein
MAIMKRQLLISIEAGKDTCQECEFHNTRVDSCELFSLSLDDEGHRLPKCIEAEGQMIEATIRCAAKAA